MATLSVLRFSTTDGATIAIDALLALNDAGRFQPRDVAMVSWKPGERVPDLKRAGALRPQAPMGPGFWSLLCSHLFCLPAAAAAAGLAAGGAYCSLADLGIRDDFLQTIRERLTPGMSALFVLSDDANVDRLIRLLDSLPFTVASTNLSTRQLEGLLLGFGACPRPDAASGDPPPELPGKPAPGQPLH